MNPPPLTDAALVEAALEASGLSGVALARRLNIDPRTLRRWRRGTRTIQRPSDRATLQAIVDAVPPSNPSPDALPTENPPAAD